MEEEPTGPNEQKLFAVFNSCLTDGQNKLDKDGLLTLCKKLELEDHHRNAIFELLEIDSTQKFISFYEFRDKFLRLLGISQEGSGDSFEQEFNGKSLILLGSKMNKKQVRALNSQEHQSGDMFVHQRWQETFSNQNSLLNEDVNSFCNRGAALPKQAIELIFEKLDIDSDGLINVEEFSHFVQSYNSNKVQEQSNINWSTHPVRDNTKSICNKDFVHHPAGISRKQLSRNVIVEQWEVAGVWEANSLLNTLGFDSLTINLIELSNALLSELKLQRDVSTTEGAGEHIRLLKGALTLCQEEVRNLHSSMEHLSCERDKLRADIVEANDRANLLASENDEQQTRVEKNCQEQIRQLEAKHIEAMKDLSSQLHSEREKSSSSLKSLEDQLQQSQQEEQRIKSELSNVLEELKQLEQESRSQNDEILRLENCNSQLSIQMQELANAQAQVESIETKENEQVSELMAHIKSLQEEMKTLRDHNDELTSELEMLKHRDNDAKSVVSSVDVRSTISDDNDGVVSMPTTEVSDTEDEDKQQSKPADHTKVDKAVDATRNRINLDDGNNGSSINKLTEIIQEFRNFLTSAKFCTDCSILRTEVSNLISELELYQSSMPMSAPLPSFNKKKKHLRNLANELEAESRSNDRQAEIYRDLIFNQSDRTKHYKRMSSSDDTIHDMLDENIDDFCIKAMKNKLTGLRDYASRTETENNNKKGAINNLGLKKLNVQGRELLKSEETRHAVEKQLLLERCNDLEKSLELLRSEYEQCEDYWASKLDEERQLFEQEQKISDEKFAELIDKMAEYEEQFNTTDRSDGRLSPIEEKSSLESQYNYLEEEFERWKLDTQEEMEKKEREVEELKAKLDSGKKLSLADISVQFPDEDDPPNKFPELYNVLCSPSGSAEGGSDRIDSAVVVPEDKNDSQPCHQCHKSVMQTNSDCHDEGHQQHQLGQKRSHGRSEGKGSKRHHHYHQKRFEGDAEYKNLLKQKERLKQEIGKLQGMKVMNANHMYPLIGTEEQNIFSNLYAKLYAQEHKLKYIQFVCQAQQKESQRAMQAMWKQHVTEVHNLHGIIRSTEGKLNQQMKMNKDLNEKLIKGDLLTKELFVENAQHLETIKRLEQHCQILTESRIDSTPA